LTTVDVRTKELI